MSFSLDTCPPKLVKELASISEKGRAERARTLAHMGLRLINFLPIFLGSAHELSDIHEDLPTSLISSRIRLEQDKHPELYNYLKAYKSGVRVEKFRHLIVSIHLLLEAKIPFAAANPVDDLSNNETEYSFINEEDELSNSVDSLLGGVLERYG